MGAAASSRAAADPQQTEKGSTGRLMWKRRGAGGVAGNAPAAQPLEPGQCCTTDRLRHRNRRDRGDKRSTQSADGALRRVRTKLRHVAPVSEAQPAAEAMQPDASADVKVGAWDVKKAAASVSDTSQEIAAVFMAATLPAMHLSVRTKREPGDAAGSRRQRQRQCSQPPATAMQPQPAKAAVAHAAVRPVSHRRGKSSGSSSGDGGRSSMAATVHSLGRSLRRFSIGSGRADSPADRPHQQPASADAVSVRGPSSTPSTQQAPPCHDDGNRTEEPSQSPQTPATDAPSGHDAMSSSGELQQRLPRQRPPCSAGAGAPSPADATPPAAPHAHISAAPVPFAPLRGGEKGARGAARGRQPADPLCSGHPLDGTPRSLVRHPLRRARPSPDRLDTRLHTVSTDSTWLLPAGGGAGADDSASEWSALELQGGPRQQPCYACDFSDDSDSDSEFWGGLAARAMAAKRRRTLADLCGDAASLRLSRAAAAAQHPIFDLTNAEEAVLAHNAALYEELLR